MIIKLLRRLPGMAKPRGFSVNDVRAIGELEPSMRALDDDGLRSKAAELKKRAMDGEHLKGRLRIEAFALVREAARRVLGQRPYDVQIAGGLVLSDGRIAEMRTGEGKTLVAALPTFLFALAGKGVHVVTVNDYLAARDAGIVGRVHRFLGLTVGVIGQGMADPERRVAYACDVTYGTNSEFGFDYLRDNLRFESSQMVQRGHPFAIVDEVDSVLIDEARTPLVISGPAADRSAAYLAADRIAASLRAGEHYTAVEKEQTVLLTEAGVDAVERAMREAGLVMPGESIYDPGSAGLGSLVDMALKARVLFLPERDYIVKDGQVVIVDAFTGRTMPGRRFSDGLHQALEAKEGVQILPEDQTLTSITYQNLFRMYGVLAGMTGTAETEKDEFASIYGLEVVPVPTNRPVIRVDEDDEVYLTEAAKLDAVAEAAREAWERRQPVLIGTASIEKSEAVAARLVKEGFVRAEGGEAPEGGKSFRVLNARNHANEARIVAQAGVPGAVTIATNMAGRGTDIQLGGSLEMMIEDARSAFVGPEEQWPAVEEKVRSRHEAAAAEARAAGGLFVIGTERHESRRIDNQLRGRSGRQGDPGRSRFYVSLEDDVTRVFATDRFRRLLGGLGLEGSSAIRHPLVTKGLEKAQRNIEARNFDIRRNVVRFDDVANDQRKAVMAFRQELMGKDDVSEEVVRMRADAVADIVARHVPENSFPDQWDLEGLAAEIAETLLLELPVAEWARRNGVTEKEIEDLILEAADAWCSDIEARLPPGLMRQAEKQALMTSLDRVWREHLVALEELKAAVGLRTVAQRDPIVEFRTDALEMFQQTLRRLDREVTRYVMSVRPVERPLTEEAEAA